MITSLLPAVCVCELVLVVQEQYEQAPVLPRHPQVARVANLAHVFPCTTTGESGDGGGVKPGHGGGGPGEGGASCTRPALPSLLPGLHLPPHGRHPAEHADGGEGAQQVPRGHQEVPQVCRWTHSLCSG